MGASILLDNQDNQCALFLVLVFAFLFIFLGYFIASWHVCAFSLEHMFVFLELTRAYLKTMYMRTSKDPKNAQIRKEGKERRVSQARRRERNLPHPANAFFGHITD
jgi:hypothetical protein